MSRWRVDIVVPESRPWLRGGPSPTGNVATVAHFQRVNCSRKTDRPSLQVEFEALAALVGLQLNKRDVVVCCACPENTLTYIFRCATYSEMTWKFSCTKMSFTFTAFNWSFLEFAIIRLIG